MLRTARVLTSMNWYWFRLIPLFAVVLLCVSLADTARGASVTVRSGFAAPKLPEGLGVDSSGNVYMSILPLRQLVKFAPDGSESVVGTIPTADGSVFLGIAVDEAGNVWGAVNSPSATEKGLWKFGPDGKAVLAAALPGSENPNDVAIDSAGRVYVSDSTKGQIWRFGSNGTADIWLDHASFKGGGPNLSPVGPLGSNGIEFDPFGNLFVVNTDYGRVVRVPVDAAGDPGTPETWVEDPRLVGADGLAFDRMGNLYVAANRQDQIVRISGTKRVEVLATHDDGLDFPASIEFGRGEGDSDVLYIANFAAFAAFGIIDRPPQPGLATMSIDVNATQSYNPGYPALFRNAPGLFAALKRAIAQAFRDTPPSQRPSPASLMAQ